MVETPMILMGGGVLATLVLIIFAMSGPSTGKAQSRRLDSLKNRHGASPTISVEAQMRRIQQRKDTKMDGFADRFLPKPAIIRQRLQQTGKNWTLGNYMMVSAAIAIVIMGGMTFKGVPFLLALFVGLAIGLAIPHFVVGMTIKKRVNQFNQRFPDAIELIVRGLRSGLPITETIGIVGAEVAGSTAPEFQFFCITLNIQRETGGNLAETLANLSEVLRKRAQMKLKIRAMSSESKASAYIVGSLPFFVFGMLWTISPDYIGKFFIDQRLMVAGGGALIWMAVGALIMAKMVSFEI